ncbi:hypothetical protein SynBIOSE41_03130 [Synechococcus sp. BIOS-E4-1]|nr:hypothetical protein SynBIOSE41_03130 [Synechococcus sp. BIOS-E4-1]
MLAACSSGYAPEFPLLLELEYQALTALASSPALLRDDQENAALLLISGVVQLLTAPENRLCRWRTRASH